MELWCKEDLEYFSGETGTATLVNPTQVGHACCAGVSSEGVPGISLYKTASLEGENTSCGHLGTVGIEKNVCSAKC